MSELFAAASRLRHDLGKYVRLNAPDAPEREADALRARLELDVGQTRRAGGTVETAVELFDAWRSEDGARLASHAALAPALEEIETAIDTIRDLLPRLAALSLDELQRLDAATLSVARGTAALQRAAKTST